MSYLKLIVKTATLAALVASFTACKEDGGFVASDFSVKDKVDQPIAPAQDTNTLNSDEIKRLAETNEKRSRELSEEISLKNEVITNLQLSIEENRQQVELLKSELQKVLSDNTESRDKDEHLKALGAEITALTETIEKDRAEYAKALENVSHNDEQIVKSLSDVITEINKIRKQKGTITDQDLLDIEKRFLSQIENSINEKQNKKAEAEENISVTENDLDKINRDISIIEDAIKHNPPELQSILNNLNELKAKKLELEAKKGLSVEQKSQADVQIVEMGCAASSKDCEAKKPTSATEVDQVKEAALQLRQDIKKLKEEKQSLLAMQATITEDIARIDALILNAKMTGKIPPMVAGLQRDKSQQQDNLVEVLEKLEAISEEITATEKNLFYMKNM